jgi:hypothetical protein
MIVNILPIIISFLIGYFFISSLIKVESKYILFLLSLSLGVGLSISSFFYFSILLIFGYMSRNIVITQDAILLIFTYILYLVRRKGAVGISFKSSDRNGSPNKIVSMVIFTIFIAVLFFSFFNFIANTNMAPHGNWDAWAIWNLHARFIFRGGANWINVFSDQISWTRAEYPWLLPSMVSRSWFYLNNESPMTSSLFAFIFTFNTPLVLYATLKIIKGHLYALLAIIILFSSRFFLDHGSSQYADIPVGYYLLNTIILTYFLLVSQSKHTPRKQKSRQFQFGNIHLSILIRRVIKYFKNAESKSKGDRILILIMMNLGSALFVKNEGLIFLSAFIVVLIVRKLAMTNTRSDRYNNLLNFSPLIAYLFLNIYVKQQLAPPNYLLDPESTSGILSKVIDIQRHTKVITVFLDRLKTFGNFKYSTISALFILLFISKTKISRKNTQVIILLTLLLILTLVGYYCVFIITPYDLDWHLSSSLKRLYIQLWPSVVFIYFLIPSIKLFDKQHFWKNKKGSHSNFAKTMEHHSMDEAKQ